MTKREQKRLRDLARAKREMRRAHTALLRGLRDTIAFIAATNQQTKNNSARGKT